MQTRAAESRRGSRLRWARAGLLIVNVLTVLAGVIWVPTRDGDAFVLDSMVLLGVDVDARRSMEASFADLPREQREGGLRALSIVVDGWAPRRGWWVCRWRTPWGLQRENAERRAEREEAGRTIYRHVRVGVAMLLVEAAIVALVGGWPLVYLTRRIRSAELP